jgi:thymidylate synthase (FAD)
MANTDIEPKPTQGAPAASPAIDRQMPDTPLVDVMAGALRHQVPVLDHGFLALVDVMPRMVPRPPAGEQAGPPTADGAIVQAARVSYGQGTKKLNEDRGLIRYLLRHHHTTPFEMVEFKFHVAMPIFVARQWIRHRTANVNEYSARYSILPDRFYTPTLDEVRKQSRSNAQGGDERFRIDEASEVQTAQEFLDFLKDVEALYPRYMKLTEQGVSRELARMGLPVNIYTEWYWKCDLHNLLRFLSLRMDSHAQEEIQAYARAMYALVEPIVPITIEAWRDYAFESMHLTRLEVEAIQQLARGGHGVLGTENKREQAEWEAKRARLGLDENLPATKSPK